MSRIAPCIAIAAGPADNASAKSRPLASNTVVGFPRAPAIATAVAKRSAPPSRTGTAPRAGPAAAADPSAIALAGADRYGTSQAVALAAFPDATGVYLASGNAFADAVSGSPAAGAADEPLLLVPPSGTLPEPVGTYLATRVGLTSAHVLGGPAAVTGDVVQQVAAAAAG